MQQVKLTMFRKLNIFIQFILWLLIFSAHTYNSILWKGVEEGIRISLISNIVFLLVYLSAYFSLKKLPWNKEKWLLIPIYTIPLVLIILIFQNFQLFIRDVENSYFLFIVEICAIWTFFFSHALLILYFEKNIESIKERSNLERGKLNVELSLLRNQLSPHFIFNALNNIYSLAYRKDEKTAPTISKLSKLLRYVLHDVSQEKVCLNEELKFINEFIEFHLLNSKDKHKVVFEKTDSHYNPCKIPPLILVSFVENAFKYSDIKLNKDGFIKIESVFHENKYRFYIKNSIGKKDFEKSTEVGIANVRRQLELHFPNGKHQLDISDNNSVFEVTLILNFE